MMTAAQSAENPVRTTCPYCGVGCGVLAWWNDDGSARVSGDPDHPSNYGRLCSKGSALGETVGLDGRLLFPEVGGERASWDGALDLVASKFSNAIAEYGPDSVAFYVSGQLLTEDYYVANKLMKGFIGSANIDTNSRLCMASSVAGHRRAFGTDTVPGTYEDLDAADLLVLVGSNLAWCHPVLYQRVAAAKAARPEMKIVLVDPRRTVTGDLADLHLSIKPDGDTALFGGLLAYLAATGRVDRTYVKSFTCGFDEAVAAASELSSSDISARTELGCSSIAAFYRLFADTEKAVTIYSQGVNQSISGTDKVNAIINCHLATGRIGRTGMGPFSITGQPNAMGGREVGALANTLASHLEIERADHRDIVQRFWHAPRIADRPGLKAVDLFKALDSGAIKALWIMATNPVDSLPEANMVEAALESCPFVAVSDVSAETDTVRHAHVRLPSTAWGEKDGTVTNSERRISRQRSFLPAPGEARPDWWQLSAVARRMGFGAAFDYPDAMTIFREHAALSAFENGGTRDFDIGAYADLESIDFDELKPFQWPQPAGTSRRQTRFFGNGDFFTASRKARFIPTRSPPPGLPSVEWPLSLNTGRVRDHWHTLTRSGKSPRLSAHIAEPFAELHPDDARDLGIGHADLVRISSRLGRVLVRALITSRQRTGSVFVPMHWTDQFASSARVDALVPPITDSVSGQPALKNIEVRAERFDAATYGFAVTREKPTFLDADYWAIAKTQGGWRIEFAHGASIDNQAAWTACLVGGAQTHECLEIHDVRTGLHRLAWFEAERLVGAVFVSREPVAVSRSWMAKQLCADHRDARARAAVAAGRAGADLPDIGAIVCACNSVGVNEIANAVVRHGCSNVESVGRLLKAGTSCGSCRAEIAAIIDEKRVLAAE